MTNEEEAVINAAIDYAVCVKGDGMPGKIQMYESSEALLKTIEALQKENDGRWRRA